MIHVILPVQFTCLTVFLNAWSTCRYWCQCKSGVSG